MTTTAGYVCVECGGPAGACRLCDRCGATLVREHRGLIFFLARRFGGAARELDPNAVLQAGRIGLMKARARFDSSRGSFANFAWRYVLGEIGTLIRQDGSVVSAGKRREERRLFFKCAEVVEASTDQQTAARILARRRGDVSLDAPLLDGDATLHDCIGADGIESRLAGKEARHLILELVAETDLNERQRQVLLRRFAEEPATLADLGQEFGVTKQRICQVEAQALGLLRRHIEARGLGREDFAFGEEEDGLWGPSGEGGPVC